MPISQRFGFRSVGTWPFLLLLLCLTRADAGQWKDSYFAPGLTKQFHVFALTRRGFGASAQPEQGYDLGTLVQDMAQVVEVLQLERVHLVGHSITGDEMTRYARTFLEKTGKLVYLDAAYDRVEARQLELKFPKLSPSRPPLGS